MTQTLMNEAEDLFFARHSKADATTRQEIEADLARFVAKVERSDLTRGIKAALIKTATR